MSIPVANYVQIMSKTKRQHREENELFTSDNQIIKTVKKTKTPWENNNSKDESKQGKNRLTGFSLDRYKLNKGTKDLKKNCYSKTTSMYNRIKNRIQKKKKTVQYENDS